MKEKIPLTIFTISIIALVILIPMQIFQSPQITGNIIIEDDESSTTTTTTCTDSDNGKDYSTKGNTCINNDCNKDSCSEKTLTEYYCSNNKKLSQTYTCESECDEGACIPIATEYTLRGSGGGGSSGGGGGGSSITIITTSIPEPIQTHNLGELGSEQNIEASENDEIVFTISGTQYTLTLTDNTNIQATINTPTETFNLLISEAKSTDLNSDSTNDISILLKSINTASKKVSLRISLV